MVGSPGALVLVGLPRAASAAPAPLDLEERVACQWRIEEVFWRHRVWPRENPGVKPPLAALVDPEVVRRKAEDGLRQSQALDELWGERLDGAALQRELERMAVETRQPEVLRELFAALGNDPYRVAECLVRPLLAGERLRERDAWHGSRHRALRRQIEDGLAAVAPGERLDRSSGEARELIWRRDDLADSSPAPGEVLFDEPGWSAAQERVASLFGLDVESPPPAGRVSALQEDRHGFHVVRILERDGDRWRLETVHWAKQPFAAWWAATRERFPAALDPTVYPFRLPAITAGPLPADAWRPTPSLPDSSRLSTAVWTGSEMIFWGGLGPWGGKSQTGSRYEPATDTWRFRDDRVGWGLRTR